jgi:hypothetical protein
VDLGGKDLSSVEAVVEADSRIVLTSEQIVRVDGIHPDDFLGLPSQRAVLGSRSLDEQSDPPAVARDAPVKLAAAISIANDSPLSGCAIACTPFMQKPLGIDSLSLHVFVPPQLCAVTRNLDVE